MPKSKEKDTKSTKKTVTGKKVAMPRIKTATAKILKTKEVITC